MDFLDLTTGAREDFSDISIESLEQFKLGCFELFEKIYSAAPPATVIIVPQRGATPFDIGLSYIERKNGIDPIKRVYLPLGTRYSVESNNYLNTIAAEEKIDQLQTIFSYFLSMRYDFSRPLVFDEVKSGASLWLLTKLIVTALKCEQLDVIGIVESTIADPKHWSGKLNRSKIKDTIKYTGISCPLIFCDNTEYMDKLVGDSNVIAHTIVNERLRKILKICFEENA